MKVAVQVTSTSGKDLGPFSRLFFYDECRGTVCHWRSKPQKWSQQSVVMMNMLTITSRLTELIFQNFTNASFWLFSRFCPFNVLLDESRMALLSSLSSYSLSPSLFPLFFSNVTCRVWRITIMYICVSSFLNWAILFCPDYSLGNNFSSRACIYIDFQFHLV